MSNIAGTCIEQRDIVLNSGIIDCCMNYMIKNQVSISFVDETLSLMENIVSKPSPALDKVEIELNFFK